MAVCPAEVLSVSVHLKRTLHMKYQFIPFFVISVSVISPQLVRSQDSSFAAQAAEIARQSRENMARMAAQYKAANEASALQFQQQQRAAAERQSQMSRQQPYPQSTPQMPQGSSGNNVDPLRSDGYDWTNHVRPGYGLGVAEQQRQATIERQKELNAIANRVNEAARESNTYQDEPVRRNESEESEQRQRNAAEIAQRDARAKNRAMGAFRSSGGFIMEDEPPSGTQSPQKAGGKFKGFDLLDEPQKLDKDGNVIEGEMSPRDREEQRQANLEGKREAGARRRQFDEALDAAEALTKEQRQEIGASLSRKQIKEARERVLNGQPLDSETEEKLLKIQNEATNQSLKPNEKKLTEALVMKMGVILLEMQRRKQQEIDDNKHLQDIKSPNAKY